MGKEIASEDWEGTEEKEEEAVDELAFIINLSRFHDIVMG